jgi:ubiquinone/menaquinone biosynthesis C-methylase UbiE
VSTLFAFERVEAAELLDTPGQHAALVAANLADIARVNRLLGGAWLTQRALTTLLTNTRPAAPLTLLDVGTGTADIPQALLPWLEQCFGSVRVIASDLSPQIVGIAQGQVAPALRLLAADGLRLPFADASCDVVACSLTLHHFAPADAVALLREMRRVARRGVVVNDLVRGRIFYLAALTLGRLASGNPLTRHDGPLSVRRAYTSAELRALLRQAGLAPVGPMATLGYRVALAARSVGE